MNRPNKWDEECHEMRITVETVLVVVALIFLILAIGCSGMLDDSEYEAAHAQAQHELKESGAWTLY